MTEHIDTDEHPHHYALKYPDGTMHYCPNWREVLRFVQETPPEGVVVVNGDHTLERDKGGFVYKRRKS